MTNKTELRLMLTSVICISLMVAMPIIAPLSYGDVGQNDDQYLDAVVRFQDIPEDVAITIYSEAVFDSYDGFGFDAIVFESSFVKYVNQYYAGEFAERDYSDLLSGYMTNDDPVIVATPSSVNDGGVTKVETYKWGYRVYISSQDMNAIVTSGSGAVSVLLRILGSTTPVGIIATVATTIVSLILNYSDYDGIVFDIRTGNVVELWGHEVVLPINPPRVENVHSQ